MDQPVDVAQFIDDDASTGLVGRGKLRGAQLPAERRDLDRLGTEPHVREAGSAAR